MVAERIKGEWVAWLFVKGNPKRVIASLELLGTLVALKPWTKGMTIS